MAENVNDLKQKLGEEKTSEKKEAKAAPDKENKGNGLGAKAVNIGKGAVSKAGGAAESALNEGMNQADDEAGETASQMSQDLQGMKDMKNTLSQLNDRRKEFGAAKANNQAAEYMKGLEGNASKAAAEGAKKTAGAEKKKATGEGLKAAFKGVGKAILTGIKFLFSNPIGWAILAFLIIMLIVLLIVVASSGLDQEHKQSGDYTNNPTAAQELKSIEQTVYGLYYQKYADMSIYAGVDMSEVKEPSEAIQAACGTAANYTDPCSLKTFEELTGVKESTIDENELYQEGTREWLDLKIQDINNNEKYLGLSAGALSQLDQKLHIDFTYPEQFIRPVATNCTLNMAEFISDTDNGDIDEDGKKTLKDCRLRNYDEEGNPKEIEEDIYGTSVGEDSRYWMDKTLYLSIATSGRFENEEGKAAEETYSFTPVTRVPEKDGHRYESDGYWDFGLGTLAHYVAYFQPSRISHYGIESLDIVCTGDNVVGNEIPSNGLCAGKKFGDVVTLTRAQVENPTNRALVEMVYKGGACDEEGENAEGCGGALYIPYEEIYFKDWEEGYNTYVKNQDNLVEGEEFGYVYTNGFEDGEYPVTETTDYVLYEPAISTGVPNTEVKYAIDHAITFAGTIKFDVKQQWVDQSIAEHTQRLKYEISKNLKIPLDSSIKNQDVTEHGNTGETIDYKYDVCYYYDNEMGTCGFSEDHHMVWVAGHSDVELDHTSPEEDCSKSQMIPDPNATGGYISGPCPVEEVEYYKHTYTPGHYELNGRVFFKGKEVQLSDIQESYVDENSGNNYSHRPPADDDKDKYTWGEIQTATITSHKEGYLQTFAIYGANVTPNTDEIVGLSYLEDYINGYQTIVPSYTNDGWACYLPNKTPNDKDWIDDSGRIINFQYASEFSKGETESGTLDPVTGVTSELPGDDLFCYADKNNVPTSAASSLSFSSRPLLQIASFAGKLKFEVNEDGELLSDVAYTYNNISTSPNTATDTRYRTLGVKYGKEFINFAGMYGVDPTLAALIAAENGTESGNIMGVTDGEYKAYNLGTRSPSTLHYGGSHNSEVENNFWEQVKEFFSKIPFFGRTTHERDTVDKGSKEDIEVTINDGQIIATDKETGERLDDLENEDSLTQEELSVKLASMKIQYLQEVYQFNMPMVITAYKYGRDYVESILDIYERTTGVTRAAAISNTMDTAWADFRGALYPSDDATEEEVATAGRLLSYYRDKKGYAIDEDIVASASDYVERVLSRLTLNGLYYQKVDREYIELSEEDVEQLKEIEEIESNTAQHTIGVWMYGILRDTVKENETTHSGANRGNIFRAWGLLTKETGTIEAQDWYEITGGQINYPEKTWEIGNFGADPEVLYRDDSYFYYRPDLTEESKALLISDMMSFGDDSYYGETDYRDVDFWKNHYSRLLGATNDNWKSHTTAVELFGQNPDQDDFTNLNPTIDRFLFVDNAPVVLRRYGWMNTDNNRREYSDKTIYLLDERDEIVKFPFPGVVTEVDKNEDGYYVVMNVDSFYPEEDRPEIEVVIGHLSSVNEGVKAGTVINRDTDIEIGSPTVDGDNKIVSFNMTYNGDTVDFDEVYRSFPQEYDFGSWASRGSSGSDPFLPEGGSLFPIGGDPLPGDVVDALFESLIPESGAATYSKYQVQKLWDEVHRVTYPNIVEYMYNCTNWAAWRMYMVYGITDKPGNGINCAGNLVSRHGGQFTDAATGPVAGSLVSSKGINEYGHVLFIERVTDDGRVLVSEGNYNGDGSIHFEWYSSLADFVSRRRVVKIASPR